MSSIAPRAPCPHCGTEIVVGALKCRGCRRWLGDAPRGPSRTTRALALVLSTVVSVAAVLVSSRESPVGEAPPLTPLASAAASPIEPAPASIGPEPSAAQVEPAPDAPWRARHIRVDVHPLDVVFHPSGKSIYVSGDDASVREYEVKSGRLLHMAKVPAQGDRLRLLHDRYLAMVRFVDAGHIPVLDTSYWDRDPIMLAVGAGPADIVALPDGRTAVAASSRGKKLSWFQLGDGRWLADIKLPHATSQLFVARGDGRPYLAALGELARDGRPAGAWIDLFDPSETPFGATRRSLAAGREPGEGAVTAHGGSIFFVDRVSNAASLLPVDGSQKTQTTTVGQAPVAAFSLNDDRHGVTLDVGGRTATVVDLATMRRLNTLMLAGAPNAGAASGDGRLLFVALGGAGSPPAEGGAAVIGGDPPKVLAYLDTGRGAARVAAARDGSRAAVSAYWGRAVTILERTR